MMPFTEVGESSIMSPTGEVNEMMKEASWPCVLDMYTNKQI